MTPVCSRVSTNGVRAVLITLTVALPLAAQGRRIVDIVRVGDPTSEREHDFAGDEATAGVIDGRTYREARGSLGYSLAVYEDTEVTLACVFRGTDGRRFTFELLVEGRPVRTRTVVSPSFQPVTIEFPIPLAITKGLTVIHVTLRAVDGATPALLELRTVQEHLEQPSRPGAAADVPGPVRAAF